MGAKLLCFCLASALVAYYIYTPIPENIEEGWKVMLVTTMFRTVGHVQFSQGSCEETWHLLWCANGFGAEVADRLGLMHYMEVLSLITVAEYVAPISDENVTVTDTEFSNVAVRLYLPRKPAGGLRRAVIYFHGGGWCVGQAGMKSYDLLSRWTSNQLDAVVVSVDYRLAPKYHFPVQFEDVYSVTKFFLQSSVLSQYGVDPNRVCVAGDSAGGNLAAAVAQKLLEDSEVTTRLRAQVLLYPALQTLDLNLPSYQENENGLILPKSLMVRFWSEYFTSDSSLREAMASNRHVPAESGHLFQFVNWSNLLPEEMKKDYVYTSPVFGSSKIAEKYPGFLDPRAAPLLAEDTRLHGLPPTYVLTCEYDVLRDDGVMYVSRLRAAGVQVTHDHAKGAFHGALMFVSNPTSLPVGNRLRNRYIEWLNENL